MSSSMLSLRYCSKGCARSAESSRLRTRSRVIRVDWSASLTRAIARERARTESRDRRCWISSGQLENVVPTTCTREFLEDRGKELRRTGYTVECHADRLPAKRSQILFYLNKYCPCVRRDRILVCVGLMKSRWGRRREFGSRSDTTGRPLCRWKVRFWT